MVSRARLFELERQKVLKVSKFEGSKVGKAGARKFGYRGTPKQADVKLQRFHLECF